jgi:hypothetical protein
MIFILKNRNDRIGAEILNILFQFFYCYKYKYYLKYHDEQIRFSNSVFIKSIFKIIDEYNNELKDNSNIIVNDDINISGHGGSDICYAMGMIVQEIKQDMLSFFKEKFYKNIKDFYTFNTVNYYIPYDIENSIVIHLRLDDQWLESDYDGQICSNHYVNLINNNEKCFFTNGPNNQYNKQNPLSNYKIKTQLDILLNEFPESKVIIISSPLTKIPELNINYDMLLQNEDYNYDLFLLSKSKKIILSRSCYSLLSLFFGEQTHIHMPLWGHFSCAGFGTKYDNCNFTYFY